MEGCDFFKITYEYLGKILNFQDSLSYIAIFSEVYYNFFYINLN